MRRFLFSVAMLAALLLLPELASAQAAIAGVVRDSSGAALPGVTVEATSPALIEKKESGIAQRIRPGRSARSNPA